MCAGVCACDLPYNRMVVCQAGACSRFSMWYIYAGVRELHWWDVGISVRIVQFVRFKIDGKLIAQISNKLCSLTAGRTARPHPA